jgi:site-specific recombinase XerD
VERCPRGSLKIALSGIKFCFAVTLQRPWPVLGLVRPGRESRLPVVLSRAEVRAVLQAVRAPVYRVCLTTIYACGLRISEGAALQVGQIDSQRLVLRITGKGRKYGKVVVMLR